MCEVKYSNVLNKHGDVRNLSQLSNNHFLLRLIPEYKYKEHRSLYAQWQGIGTSSIRREGNALV